MNGLYFYKLVSSYPEDITKDCKLTVNEIDHNFITLKKSDIDDFYLDRENNLLILETKGGDKFKANMSGYTKDVVVKYDKEKGILEIHHDGVIEVIDELITKYNVSSEILSHISTDDTICGNGTENNPLGIVNVEKTSTYKAAIKVIDKTAGYTLPSPDKNSLGDRYITYEDYNEYGYLYSYVMANNFVKDLDSDWRIPTKADWDNMLNAIEPCNEDRNHDISSCNNVLGKFAGKFLKSSKNWVNSVDPRNMCDCHHHHHDYCHHDHHCCHDWECSDSDVIDFDCDCPHHEPCNPIFNPTNPIGTDAYGLALLPSGYGDGGMMFDYFGRRGKFWTSTSIQITNIYAKRFDYDKSGVVQIADNPKSIASVRLVKDYNGSNFKSIETIGGINYRCVLLPSLNSPNGYMIWMASNLATTQKKYNPVLPNNGESISSKKVFIINEWSGFDWTRKELKEGDALVIKFGPDDDRNAEYRLINGVLVNVKKDIISTVENKYDDAIDDIEGRLTVIEGEVSDIKNSINVINTRLDELDAENDAISNKLELEIQAREEVDTQTWDAIAKEAEAREEVDKQIWDAISASTESTTEVHAQIWDAIAKEAEARENVDTQIWDAIGKEAEARENVDNQIWDAIAKEAEARENVDNQIWDAISASTESTTEVHAQIWDAIGKEAEAREDVDNQIWDALNNEIERSVEQDKRLITSGSTYNCAEGLLTLKADSPENDIVIMLDSNYGTF